MISYPMELWQMFVIGGAFLVVVILLARYVPAKLAVSRLDATLVGQGLPLMKRTVSVDRSSSELVETLQVKGYRVAETEEGAFLIRPQPSLFRLKHLGLYWFQALVPTSSGVVELELKAALAPWGILLAIVTIWVTLSYRMPSGMKYVVLLVLIPDVLSLLLMRTRMSQLASCLH